jgi:hypothetical protein
VHVIVYCNEGPDSGMVYMTRELADEELLVARTFANQVADSLGLEIAAPSGHIPNCCGDLRVEFIDHEPWIVGERYQGSVVIWSGESYYFASE